MFLTCTKDIQHYKGREDFFERKISLSLLNNTVFYNLTPYQQQTYVVKKNKNVFFH